MTLITALYFSLISLVSCSEAAEEQKKAPYSIKGTIKNYSGKKITLQHVSPQGLVIIDTSDVNEKGEFYFDPIVKGQGFAMIPFTDNQKLVLTLDSVAAIKLNIDFSDFYNYTIEGSAASKEIKEFLSINNRYGVKIQNLQNSLMATQDPNQQKQIQGDLDKAINEVGEMFLQHLKNCKEPLAMVFGVEFMQIKPDGETAAKIIKAISGIKNEIVQTAKMRLESETKTAVGSLAPDIQLADTSGKTISLSSLKGKIVLIDFWASWCRPCRMENPNVVKMYERFKNKGFEIYGVSLDQNMNPWKKAIFDDRITWVQVSDLKGWSSSAAQLYSVTSIPQTVLIDRDGKIIAKGLRGAALEQKVESLLN